MTKIKNMIVSVMLAALLVLVAAVALPVAVSAEEIPADVSDTSEDLPAGEDTSETEDETLSLVDRFIGNLKEKYGEDYEYYLNAILEQWGSVEAYLLSLTDNIPEEFQAGYNEVIQWLGDYAPVWAPVLAVALVIFAVLFGKKVVNKWFNKIVEARIQPIQAELNKQSEAQAAQLKVTRALLGTSEKFAEERKASEQAEKKLLE